ncbi:MAG: hypothetical protein NXY57DRAFT_1034901 [Lentinula lateritia]|uniref:Uncharacterized protein n=1 Tax=Lentinula lateritia TaxID=40482 RepID=A0ABQ8VLH6_9AGAR|nr:MAG: hypothetical protein NXY57DRAFT_1034901 [Lentinula lateritia]KAJ4497225.1 hypothetical protein C8R41DRAFT_865775 [Lentinula lateritia]
MFVIPAAVDVNMEPLEDQVKDLGSVLETTILIDEASYNGETWEECFIGCYQEGGIGSILAMFDMHFALKLGYRASVSNLVSVNNEASHEDLLKQAIFPKRAVSDVKTGKGEETAATYSESFVLPVEVTAEFPVYPAHAVWSPSRSSGYELPDAPTPLQVITVTGQYGGGRKG